LRSLIVLLTLVGLAAAAGCGGGSGDNRATVTQEAAATAAVDATPTPDPQTQTGLDLAQRLKPALLQSADLPAGFVQRQDATKALTRVEVPGLTSAAAGAIATYSTPDGKEYVTGIAVLPDDLASLSGLLDGFGTKTYIDGLTGGAPDSASTPLDVSHAPAGARGLNYTGSVRTPDGNQTLSGQVVALVHGKVYLVLLHASYGLPSPQPIDVTDLARTIDQRLSAMPEAG